MKKLTFLLALPLVMGMFSCKKDSKDDPQPKTDTVTVTKPIAQAHDQNAMMKIMHSMMTKMDTMKMTMEVDKDFAMMMMMHHQGAIDMANEELKSGDNAEMKAMATKIIAAQTKEKADLMEFVMMHTGMDTTGSHEFHEEMMMSMHKMEEAADLRVVTGDTDNDFANLMITHHQAATENAQSVIDHGHHAAIKTMAKKMIKDQQEEIIELQDWLIKNKPY